MATISGKTVLTGMVEKVAFVNNWPMLMKATSDDDSPTPGYLYQEIIELSFVSVRYCTALQEFLVDRLEKTSFHIKFKVLRIMKHTVENGHEDFSNGLRRHAIGIQNAIKFSGAPDPLHGNAPYVAVRKAAMDLSEVLFDTEHTAKHSSPKRRSANGKAHGTVSQSKIHGFGNTNSQVQTSKSLSEVIKGGVEQFTSNFSPKHVMHHKDDRTQISDYRPINGLNTKGQRSYQYRNSPNRAEGLSDGYKAVDIDRPEEKPDPDQIPFKSEQQSSRPGGGWADHHVGSRGSNDSSGKKSGASSDLTEKLASVSVEDWSQEIKLVEDFVSSNNARTTPSREELNQFSKSCSTSSCEKVLEILDTKLTDNSATQMRSLCAIESIIREDLVSVEKTYETLEANLKLLTNSQEKLVQAKSKKILRQLERLVEEAVESERSRTTSPLHQARSGVDTLVPISPDQDIPLCITQPSVEPTNSFLFSGMSLEQKCDVRLNEPLETRTSDSVTIGLEHTVSVEEHKKQSNDDQSLLLHIGSPAANRTTIANSARTVSEDNRLPSKSTVVEDHAAKETVLDALLDLSTTEHATLQPVSSTDKMNNISSGQCQLNSIISPLILSGESKPSKDKENISNSTVTIPKGQQTSLNSSTDNVTPRTSHLDDLLSSIDPFGKSTTEETGSHILSEQRSSTTDGPLNKPQGKSMEEIAKLYPQLSRTQLSGTSAMPLSLSRKPQTGSFAFVETEEDKKEKRTKVGQESAFGFVHDAMAKAGKR